MNKVLVFGFTETLGGVETFFMTYYRKMNLEKYSFDFITVYDNMIFSDEIKKNNGKIYKVTNFKKNPIKYRKEVTKIMKEGKYDTVYVNMLSAANLLPIKIAKKNGIKNIIAHSHNSNTPKNIVKIGLHRLNKIKIKNYANKYIACSEKAGQWMYGDKINFTVLNNAVDIDKFSYNSDMKQELMKELKNDYIVGHIGRFSEAKNQEFIIEIAKKVLEKDNKISFVLIGEGENKQKIKEKIQKENLEKKIFVLNSTTEVFKFYSVFDMFILPSRFEGLPIVGIEAQANGLPCVFSDKITKELKINDNIEFDSIENTASWVERILNKPNRVKKIQLKDYGYDINYNFKEFEKLLNFENRGLR
ncbi:GDP-mannose-dependent alpha-(1-6)-phosphatidylinositol monomannoside mannosyltransferase [Turicibacter sanguinis]|nr:GDP-mannose-dependent alpha-(1-6)-phosphatidylinositol monomannoside mannosyltransferase [Turicibacter sanguinis]